MTEGGNRQNVAILSLTLGVVMLSFGMVMPTMPFYVESMAVHAIGDRANRSHDSELQRRERR
jgi:hypothetical protein